ncbi:unnamed protein product [Durusdinium trenchii]|uniref:Inositol polyphosphate-related phosphatase domain-containing protein n=1 Tax=Durusdinium trenchii TaxID=1381693 RepID=A0ABP0PNS3_9DINO
MDESHRSGEGNQSGNQDTENTQGEADRLREAKQTKVAEKVARMDICMAEVLRATRAHQAFQNTAEALRPDFGGNFYSKSFMTEEIACFWSHSWHGGHWMKVMTLLIHYNGQAAVLFGSLFALVATVCFSLGLLPGMVRFPEAPDMQWSTWSLASGFTAAVFVLVLWRPQQLIFLDRICINNSDAEQKKASILSLGGILKRSQRLMVLWDPSWCDRLWCLFELAAFLKSKQAQKNQVLLVQPTILGPCSLINFFCVSFVMLPATTISFAGGSFGLVVPALGVVLFLLISGCFVFAVLRAYFRSLEALKERWQTMVDRWNIPYLGRARPVSRFTPSFAGRGNQQSHNSTLRNPPQKLLNQSGFSDIMGDAKGPGPDSMANDVGYVCAVVSSDLNAAWPAWANAAQESAGAAFRKAADAARVHAGQVKAAVDSQVWPGLPPTGGEASPFESEVPFHGSLPPVRLRVCSWNLHGNMIEESDDVRKWLMPDDEPADLVLVAVQELVDLGPKTVVMNPNGDEQRQMLLERRVEQALSKGGRYVKVCGFGMVGLALLVYIQPWLACGLRQLRIDRVKTGLDGMGGNKGGVCARFLLGSLSVCLVNVHLASGQHATTERSQHLAQVLSDAFQGTSAKGALRPKKLGFERSSVYHVEAHELCIITGDFNSRLDLPKEAQWPSGPQEAWLARDQIMLGQVSSLRGYREGVITFAPTYKYKIGTDALNTKRAPAWCDRVVFKSEAPCQLQLLEYASLPDLRFTSDHHPVTALFEVE